MSLMRRYVYVLTFLEVYYRSVFKRDVGISLEYDDPFVLLLVVPSGIR